jgi:hypothetical protein
VFRPWIEDTLAQSSNSLLAVKDLHAGLDALKLDAEKRERLAMGALARVRPKPGTPEYLLEEEQLNEAGPQVPVLPNAQEEDPEEVMHAIDKLLRSYDSKNPYYEPEHHPQSTGRFAQVSSEAQGGSEGVHSSTDGEHPKTTARDAHPATESFRKQLQREDDRDLPMDFLKSEGVVKPKSSKFTQKKKAKGGPKELRLSDQQVVSQTYAKAQTTLDRIARTTYGMSQRVKVLNNVEKEIQKELSLLGDQEYTQGSAVYG